MTSDHDPLLCFRSRRSIRRYQSQPVPAGMIEQLLTAAIWAPSAHNRQPWRFAIIQTEAVKHRLAAAMGARLRADLAADGAPPELIEQDANRSYQRITTAPVLVLLCLSLEDMDVYPDAARRQNEWVMAVQSTAMAGQNLLLAAHALGLGACWMCAPLFCPDVVQRALELPASWQPQGLITLGYPAENRAKNRRPLAQHTRYF
ncbi:MAG: nitroreductase family protein [Candidatus Promineifilaceae bacterium]